MNIHLDLDGGGNGAQPLVVVGEGDGGHLLVLALLDLTRQRENLNRDVLVSSDALQLVKAEVVRDVSGEVVQVTVEDARLL